MTIAAQLSSALEHLQQGWLGQTGAQALDRMLTSRKVPLASAIDAPRHEIATADAGTLSYYADTQATGRPLVLLHGVHAAASSYEMRPLFESFRAERPVYALDLPGFGFSERKSSRFTPTTYVHAIEHLLRNVAGSQGADVVALSLTSEYVARVAVDMPELLRSLVLISPTGFAGRREVGSLERRARLTHPDLAARLSVLPGSRLLYEALSTRPSLRFFLRRSFEGPIDDGMLAYAYATSHQPGAWQAPMTFVAGGLFPTGDARARYAHVRVPTLVLYDRDPYTGFGELEPFLAKHPSFSAQKIEPTRGLPQFDAPQQTVEALRSYFRRLDETVAAPTNGVHTTRFIGQA